MMVMLPASRTMLLHASRQEEAAAVTPVLGVTPVLLPWDPGAWRLLRPLLAALSLLPAVQWWPHAQAMALPCMPQACHKLLLLLLCLQ